MKRIMFVVLFTLTSTSHAQMPPERYLSASVNSSGDLEIHTTAGRTIVQRKDKDATFGDQEDYRQIAISPSGNTVGWLAEYPFCCTSYPIPLKLFVYKNGKRHVFTGAMTIWEWKFNVSGTRVVLEEGYPHGDSMLYEMRDIATGRLIRRYQPPLDRDTQQPLPDPNVPQWVVDYRNGRF